MFSHDHLIGPLLFCSFSLPTLCLKVVWRDCTNSQNLSFISTNYHQLFSFAHSHRQYADESLGFLIVRGENVAMMGLMGAVSRPPEIAGYKRVALAEIKHVRP
jgi:hypothetical protein